MESEKSIKEHSSVKKMAFQLHELGQMHYGDALEYQQQLFDENLALKKEGKPGKHHLILVEHFPVYTLGKSGKANNLLIDVKKIGAEYFHTNRGGDITFHGPGQLVAYPILDIEVLGIGLARYVWQLEETIIQLLAQYSITATRDKANPGVWLDIENPATVRKICALGVKSSRYITMHGLALNVNTDLKFFEYMIPCGIQGRQVTSLAKEMGEEQDFSAVKEAFVRKFEEVFQLQMMNY